MKNHHAYNYSEIIKISLGVLDSQIKHDIFELQKSSDELVELINNENDLKSDENVSNVIQLIYSCVNFFKNMKISESYTLQEHEKILKLNIVMNINLSLISGYITSANSLVKKLKSCMNKTISKFYAKLCQLINLSEITISGGTGTVIFGLVSANVGFTFKV